MIEVCRCGGAICSHGTCVKCQGCRHCGRDGANYYQDRVDNYFEGMSREEREEEGFE